MARAMVLAAGLGTRLRPLTEELPKPLVPIGDRPLVAHIGDRLRAQGFPELVLNVHHGSEHFRGGIHGLQSMVHLVHEAAIRGTAGGIAGARGLLGPPPVIVWNGDILAHPDVPALLALAEDGGLVLSVAPRPRGTGTVGVDGAGDVVRLRGEVFGEEVQGGDYVGIAALGGATLDALPELGCLIGDHALPALRSGGRIRTLALEGEWEDVGTVPAYHAANLSWLTRTVGPDASWAHPLARVAASVRLESSIVGEGAVVDGVGALERVVVWPGAHVVAPLRDVVVTRSGRAVPVG